MKNRRLALPSVAALMGMVFLLLGSSGGVGTFQREDRTGSPLSLNTTCRTCHYGGNQTASLELTLLKDSLPVQNYMPGTDYLVKVSIKSDPQAKVYGLQMVALQSENNQQGGTFYNLPDSLRAVPLWNRSYIEQKRPVATNTFFVPWRSPESNIGKIRFYAAGLAANGNGQISGDTPVWLETPLELNSATVTASSSIIKKKSVWVSGPAPERILFAEGFDDGEYPLIVSDFNGRIIMLKKIFLIDNQSIIHGLPNLPGRYVASLFDGRKYYVIRF